MRTTYLHVIPDDNIAKTDRPVTITDAATVVNAVGLELNSETRVLKLLSRVRGTYDPKLGAQESEVSARRGAWPRRACALLAGALLARARCSWPAPPARAEKADRDKPVNLEADRVTVDDAKQLAIFEGNVVLTQGTLQIRGDRMEVRQDKEGFRHGTTWGNLAYFRQKRDGVDEYIEGWAERIEYDGRAEKMQMFNRAMMKRGRGRSAGKLHLLRRRRPSSTRSSAAAPRPPPRTIPTGACARYMQPKPKEGQAGSRRAAHAQARRGHRGAARGSRRRRASSRATTTPARFRSRLPGAARRAPAAAAQRAARRAAEEALPLARRREGRLPGGAQRRGDRAARPQRRRQDHLLLHDGRAGADGRRRALSRRQAAHPHADAPARPAGTLLPAAGGLDFPAADRRRKRAGGARALSRRSPKRSATGSTSCCTTCTSAICTAISRSACRAGSAGASRSRARWRPSRASSCSTSRSRASIRSPCWKSRKSSVF